MFCIGLESVAKIMYKFREAILKEAGKFIKFPANGRETALEFEKPSYFTQTALPQVVGAIDRTPKEILCKSLEIRVDYFPRKQKYTVHMQAIVGANLIFFYM